jgi:hypothetical protein
MSDEIVINITPDPSINISAVDSNEQIALNPLTLNQGLINHSVTHQKNGSDELAHNLLGGLDGGQSGEYYHLTSGEYSNLVTGSVVRPNETGEFIINAQTGQFYANSNPSGFITGVDLSAYATEVYVTGISGSLQTQITNLSVSTGNLNTRLTTAENDISILESATGELNSYIIDLQGVTGTFVLYSETGQFYSSSNPSGFITGVDLSFSGNYYTKDESESRYVNTTGAETILGDKTFHDKVYINNLYVTGTETIVNTTNANVASNYIMLNLTGGAVDGGIFFVTGSGLTGINDSGAIIGFDHADKFKFGIATRASDLSTLNTIAAYEQVTGISGGLQSQISNLNSATGSYVLNNQTGIFYTNDNPSGFITGVDLSNYVLTSETGQFYAASNPSGFITGVDLSFSGNYYTKNESESRYVNITGTETIVGDKSFNTISVNSLNTSNITATSYVDGIILKDLDNYHLKWSNGRLYVISPNGYSVIRVNYCDSAPTQYDDFTLGFEVGSYWSTIDGATYICENNDEGLAVWVKTPWLSSTFSNQSEVLTQNCVALQIIASGDVVEGGPIPYDIDITITANGMQFAPYSYTLSLSAGTTFDSTIIAASLANGLYNVIEQSGGPVYPVYSYNNFVAISNGGDNFYELQYYSLICDYGTNSQPANINVEEIIEFCNIIPNSVGEIVITDTSPNLVWMCTSIKPIIWTPLESISSLVNENPIPNTIPIRLSEGEIYVSNLKLKNSARYTQINPSNNPYSNVEFTFPDTGGTITTESSAVTISNTQTIIGNKTFNSTSTLFPNEAGSSQHSVLTQQQLMLNGHKFRQLVNVNSKTVGANPNTTAGAFQVLGMYATIGNTLGQTAAAYTLDGLYCADISNATIPINNEIDVFFHGVALRFFPSPKWKARINFGVPFSKTVAFANQDPMLDVSSNSRQWGVEFYYDTITATYRGRLYYYFDGPIQYGSPFNLSLYSGSSHTSWGGYIYSMRMRQIVVSTRRLRFQFYINTSAENNGGTQLSKITPISSLDAINITIPNYKFDGKHINFEVASNSSEAPDGIITMQCTNMYCQFK